MNDGLLPSKKRLRRSTGNFFVVTRNPRSGRLMPLVRGTLEDDPQIATWGTIEEARAAAKLSAPCQAWGGYIMEYGGVGCEGVPL